MQFGDKTKQTRLFFYAERIPLPAKIQENIRKFALQISVPNPYWRETFDKIVSIKALMIELLT